MVVKKIELEPSGSEVRSVHEREQCGWLHPSSGSDSVWGLLAFTLIVTVAPEGLTGLCRAAAPGGDVQSRQRRQVNVAEVDLFLQLSTGAVSLGD